MNEETNDTEESAAPPKKLIKHPAIIGGGVLVALIIGLWVLGHALIDKEVMAKRVYEGVKQLTGYETRASRVELSVLPLPSIQMQRFEVKNHRLASNDRFLLAEEVTITLDPIDLIMGKIKADSFTIHRPVVELEVFPDRTTNWSFVDRLKTSDMDFIRPNALAVEGGTVNLTNRAEQQTREFNAINVLFELDELSNDVDVDIAFTTLEKTVEIMGSFTAKAFSSVRQYSFGLDLDIREGENHIFYKGEVGHSRNGLNYDGVFSINFVDVMPWLEAILVEEAKEGILRNITEAVPFSVNGKARSSGARYALTEIAIKAGATSGSGQIIHDDNAFPQTQAAFNFSSLDFGDAFDPHHPVSDDAFNRFIGRFLPENVSANIEIKSDRFSIGGIDAGNARFMATLDDGEMVVNQMSLSMAGDTEFLVFGIIKRSLDKSIQFDGNIELIGEKLQDFARNLGFTDEDFVTDHDGKFRAKTNVFLSRANSIVSDFKFQAGDFFASGGMTMNSEAEVDSEFTLRISGIKLDPFAALMTPTSPKDLKVNDFEDIIRRLDWLDEVRYKMLFNLVLQNYTLSKTKGKQSSMHILLEPGKVAFTDTKFELGGITFSGDFNYAQNEEVPFIGAEMHITRFNLEPYTADNLRRSPVPRDNFQSVWKDDHFSFGYLKGFNSKLDLSIDKVQHPEFPMRKMRMIAEGKNGRWVMKGFKAAIWDGTLKANGNFDVNSVPKLGLSFSFEDIASVKLVEALAGHSNFRGKVSLNGQINTSGLSPHNWVKNGRGTFVMLGQNIVIKGFDVSSVVQAIPSIRSVADVANTVRVSLLKRYTTFSVVEGSFYMDAGVLRASELKLRAKHSIGSVTGEMNLFTWMMNCAIDFGLTSLARGDYPHLGIGFTNSMDDPVLDVDTRSLEAFIARKKLR